MILSPFRNSAIAAVGYGTWAMFANGEHSRAEWLMAGLVQAFSSFTITMSITLFLHWIYNFFGKSNVAIVITFTTSFLLVFGVSYGAHYISNTPNIWETIMPSLLIGSCYLLSYLFALRIKSEIKP